MPCGHFCCLQNISHVCKNALANCTKHQQSTIPCSSAKLVLALNISLVILLSAATVYFILKPDTISKFVFSLEK